MVRGCPVLQADPGSSMQTLRTSSIPSSSGVPVHLLDTTNWRDWAGRCLGVAGACTLGIVA